MSKLYYKGEIIFLYVKFFNKDNTLAKTVANPKVRILHEHDGNIYEDLSWSELNALSDNEYYFNYEIPYDNDCGQYDVIYYGEIDGEIATVIESFHIINKSEVYNDAIKLYGYIDDDLNKIPLANVGVEVISSDSVYITQSYTKENGYWETYIYPGEYMCTFRKDGFKDFTTNIQLGNDNNEIQFNNISLESNKKRTSGNGICEVSDSYVLKNGIPLDGLKIKAYNILSPSILCASSVTDNHGKWSLHLDPGFYFLKTTGNSMNQDFDKTFRLRINDDCKYEIEDMDNNKAVVQKNHLSTGSGSKVYKDVITDGNDNPIVDVQVTAYKSNNPIAQCYTDSAGKYELHLDPGTYVIDIYHPSFKDIPEINITL